MFSEDEILRVIREKVDHPATGKELLQILRIPKEERSSFKRRIRALVAAGSLVEIRGHRFGLPDRMNLVVGRVSTNPRGFAFVDPEVASDGGPASIYIAGNNLNQAMHGDRVVVRVEHRRDGDRAEGRILRILERGAQRSSAATTSTNPGLGFVVPFDRRILMDVQVPKGEAKGARRGDMVTVEITRWPTSTRPALGRVVEVIGDLDAPGVDTTVIIRKYNLPDAHSDEPIAEAKRLGTAVEERDIQQRTDFRRWMTVTIDGENARDFDDAISIDRLPNGNFWLGVHIADVAHYVAEGSALDQEAYERATSVYFPERAVHMFPHELSTGLCSLNPHVDRLVQSCLMEIDRRTGSVVRYEMHDGVIYSHERMTYTAVNADSDRPRSGGDGAVPDAAADVRADARAVRHSQRAAPPPRVDRFRSAGVARSCSTTPVWSRRSSPSERNVAHRIIEEFMLARQRDGGRAPREARHADALPRFTKSPIR